MYSKEEIAKFLKESVEWLIEEGIGCATLKLDDRLGICVGWLPGYGEEKRDDCIQSKEEPDFAINAGIKVYTSDDMRTDYEFINMPYYDDGEVIVTDVSIESDEDYDKLAEYFLKEYEGMKDLEIEEDGLIVEHKDEVEESVHDDKVNYSVDDNGVLHIFLGNKSMADVEDCGGMDDHHLLELVADTLAGMGYDWNEDGTISKIEEDCHIVEADTESVKKNKEISQDELKKLSDELYEHFADLHVYYDIWHDEDGINIEINWGDWKQDHLWCDYEVKHFIESRGHEVISHDTEVTDEDGSDSYSAIHSYIIK